jgi:hypothetical protein
MRTQLLTIDRSKLTLLLFIIRAGVGPKPTLIPSMTNYCFASPTQSFNDLISNL